TTDGFRHWLWEFRPSVPVRVGMSAVPTRCGVHRETPRYPRPRWLRTSLHQYLELRRSALPAGRLQEARLQTCTYKPQKRQDGSAFALTYSLRLRSCRLMGAFIISPLPSFLMQASCARFLRSMGITPLHCCRVGGGALSR